MRKSLAQAKKFMLVIISYHQRFAGHFFYYIGESFYFCVMDFNPNSIFSIHRPTTEL